MRNNARVFDARTIFVVACGAALGGVARYLIGVSVATRSGIAAVPFATAAINISGSFLIGLVAGSLASRPGVSPLWRLFLATGILGGYTTFSTFSLDALGLANSGALAASAAYVAGSVALGIGAAYVGLLVARAF